MGELFDVYFGPDAQWVTPNTLRGDMSRGGDRAWTRHVTTCSSRTAAARAIHDGMLAVLGDDAPQMLQVQAAELRYALRQRIAHSPIPEVTASWTTGAETYRIVVAMRRGAIPPEMEI